MLPVGPDQWPSGPDVFAARSVKSMIPNDFIQTLLSRIDIVDVIDRYVPLKKAGANYQACCPFHGEKTPSFTVGLGRERGDQRGQRRVLPLP